VETLAEEGIVFFNNLTAKYPFESDRFKIDVNIPNITKLYFKPETFWKTIVNDWIRNQARNICSSIFSHIKNTRSTLKLFVLY
jgi:hypothetical protein